MALTQDFTDKLKDMMGAWPMDAAALEDSWKSSAAFGEKASSIAFSAFGKSADIATGWTMETIGQMGALSKAKETPADYAKALADFASAQMDSASSHMTALGDLARDVQSESLELASSAGKEFADDASAAAATTVKAAEKTAQAAAEAPAAAPAPAPKPAPAAPKPAAKPPASTARTTARKTTRSTAARKPAASAAKTTPPSES